MLLLSIAAAVVSFCLMQVPSTKDTPQLSVRNISTAFRPFSASTKSVSSTSKTFALEVSSAGNQFVNLQLDKSHVVVDFAPSAPQGAGWRNNMVHGVKSVQQPGDKLQIVPRFGKSTPAAARAEQDALPSTSGKTDRVLKAAADIEVSS